MEEYRPATPNPDVNGIVLPPATMAKIDALLTAQRAAIIAAIAEAMNSPTAEAASGGEQAKGHAEDTWPGSYGPAKAGDPGLADASAGTPTEAPKTAATCEANENSLAIFANDLFDEIFFFGLRPKSRRATDARNADALDQSQYAFKLNEIRVICYCASGISAFAAAHPGVGLRNADFSFSPAAMAKTMGLSQKGVYSILAGMERKLIAKGLFTRFGRSGGRYSFRPSKKLLDGTIGLAGGCTAVQNGEVVKYRSCNALRLYGALIRRTGPDGGTWKISPADFRHCFGLETTYADFCDVVRHCLAPAVKAVNATSADLSVGYETIKEGNRTTGVQLTYRLKKGSRLAAKPDRRPGA